ncbi:unnamed protein product, partial [Rotaria sp. Silwood2]
IFELIISRMFEHMLNARIVDTVLPIPQNPFCARGGKSNFRQSLIMGTLGNIYHIRKMEWCFSNNFTSYTEVYLRLDGEKRQLPSPVFN